MRRSRITARGSMPGLGGAFTVPRTAELHYLYIEAHAMSLHVCRIIIQLCIQASLFLRAHMYTCALKLVSTQALALRASCVIPHR